MLSDPAAAAWIAAGRPALDLPASVDGRCGRCGTEEPTVPSYRVVSDKFTDFDVWPYGLQRLCVPCAWAYSRPPNTQPALHITTTALTEYRDSTRLLDLLTAGPLPDTDAVVVPASRRQHILPTAAWAHLATDGFLIRWNAAAAHRLAELAWIRTDTDIAWPQLCLPAPPPWHLTGQTPKRRARILAAWRQLKPWRALPQLWAAARRLTNPPQQLDDSDL
jgi:hypothetical protein